MHSGAVDEGEDGRENPFSQATHEAGTNRAVFSLLVLMCIHTDTDTYPFHCRMAVRILDPLGRGR